MAPRGLFSEGTEKENWEKWIFLWVSDGFCFFFSPVFLVSFVVKCCKMQEFFIKLDMLLNVVLVLRHFQHRLQGFSRTQP